MSLGSTSYLLMVARTSKKGARKISENLTKMMQKMKKIENFESAGQQLIMLAARASKLLSMNTKFLPGRAAAISPLKNVPKICTRGAVAAGVQT